MNVRLFFALPVSLTFFWLLLNESDAGLIVTSFSGGNHGSTLSNQTNGFVFQVGPASLSLTQLGFYDQSGDGILAAHPVGIWDSSRNLLASATVPSGTSATLNGRWRMVDITPITLLADQKYRIAARVFGDRYIFASNSPGTAGDGIAEITRTGVSQNGDGLVFPNARTDDGRFNANGFVVAASTAVPEPGSFTMFVLGGLCIGAVYCRRKLNA